MQNRSASLGSGTWNHSETRFRIKKEEATSRGCGEMGTLMHSGAHGDAKRNDVATVDKSDSFSQSQT